MRRVLRVVTTGGLLLGLAGTLAQARDGSAAPAAPSEPRTRNVAIVLYDGVEVLDFAGPAEVFQAAATQAGQDTPAFRVYTMAPAKDPILSQGFIRIIPEFSMADAPKPDILVIPGGNSGHLTADPKFMSWVSRVMGDAELTLTVCTGAFVPAKAGLLDGKTATTWYGAIEGLRRAVPTATIQEGRRFVDGGKLVTTAGVSAGIDGALHVVARLLGRSTADRTARYMEYHWAPESYLASQYSQFNPDLDESHRAISKALYDEADRHFEVAAAEWRAILVAKPGDGSAWYHLGFALHSLHHYDEAAEAATKATQASGLSPERRATAWYNVACARSLQGRKDEALVALEKAVNAGFSPRRLDGEPDLDPIRGDPRFVALASR